IFYSGNGHILHYDGTAWSEVFARQDSFPGYLMGFKDDVWASGPQGTLLHWNGSTWTDMAPAIGSPTAWIDKVAAVAPNDVWWSMGQGWLHWDGTSLTVSPTDLSSFGEECCSGINSSTIIDGHWWLVGGDGGVYTKAGANAVKPLISP